VKKKTEAAEAAKAVNEWVVNFGGTTFPIKDIKFNWGTEPEPRPELEKSATTEVIVGYRTWRLGRRYPGGVRLHSANADSWWEPHRRKEATCWSNFASNFAAPHDEPTPHHTCTCGIYALADGVDVPPSDGPPLVVGEVSLWGRVIEHSKGWRGQYAYPRRLAVVGGSQSLAGDLEATYGVPCEVLS